MKWVNGEHGLPIKSWCEDLEEKAMKQAIDLSNHPVMFRHVALMPDAHMVQKDFHHRRDADWLI